MATKQRKKQTGHFARYHNKPDVGCRWTAAARWLFDEVHNYGPKGCYKSNRTLARESEFTRRTIQLARKWLVEHQVILTARTLPRTWSMWNPAHSAVKCRQVLYYKGGEMDNAFYEPAEGFRNGLANQPKSAQNGPADQTQKPAKMTPQGRGAQNQPVGAHRSGGQKQPLRPQKPRKKGAARAYARANRAQKLRLRGAKIAPKLERGTVPFRDRQFLGDSLSGIGSADSRFSTTTRGEQIPPHPPDAQAPLGLAVQGKSNQKTLDTLRELYRKKLERIGYSKKHAEKLARRKYPGIEELDKKLLGKSR
ncbi:hypothetical protein ES703_34815 [subsurface metagenome]